VQCITEVQFAQKMVIIIAGYEAEVDALMQANPGLPRRFPGKVLFPDFTAAQAEGMIHAELKREQLTMSASAQAALPRLLAELIAAPQWSSAGDVKLLLEFTIAANDHRRFGDAAFALPESERAKLSPAVELPDLQRGQRQLLQSKVPSSPSLPAMMQQVLEQAASAAAPTAAPPTAVRGTARDKKDAPADPSVRAPAAPEQKHEHHACAQSHGGGGRSGLAGASSVYKFATSPDAGVSAEVWDAQVAEMKRLLEAEAKAEAERIARELEMERQRLEAEELARKIQAEKDAEAKRILEEQRRQVEAEQARLLALQLAYEAERLRQMNDRCPAGLSWVGNQCSGGSHYR
jgi:hypothetical protein